MLISSSGGTFRRGKVELPMPSGDFAIGLMPIIFLLFCYDHFTSPMFT